MAHQQLPRDLSPKQDASDLVQECQLHATAQFPRFKGQSGPEFLAWMKGILTRRVFRAIRYWGEQRRDRKRELTQVATSAGHAFPDPAAGATSIPDRLARAEELQRLSRAASWCREDDCRLISMHLFEGQSHDIIATELNITVEAVRKRYSRAIQRVGEALKLLTLLSERGFNGPRQDVIGLHRVQGAKAEEIAERLRLPDDLVKRWINQANKLVLEFPKGTP